MIKQANRVLSCNPGVICDWRYRAGGGMRVFLAIAIVCCPWSKPVPAQSDFVDHGVATRAVEGRGVAAVSVPGGGHYVVTLTNNRAKRGWVLITDLASDRTEQLFMPEDVDCSPSLAAPFASYVSKQGRFYTGVGGVLLELDVEKRRWLYHGRPDPKAQLFNDHAIAEDPEGRIYAGTAPSCHLISYDPKSRQAADHGRMDPVEEWPRFLACDRAGWVYCGIGPARGNIVAFHGKTGTRRQIVPEAERVAGSGWVFEAVDGKVYGTCGGKTWRMHGGVGEIIAPSLRANPVPVGVLDWTNTTGAFRDGRRLLAASVQDGWLEIHDPKTGQTRRLTFKYDALGGMGFTSLAAGPDGKLYGSTCHPMRFVRYDPATRALADLGTVKAIGNFCAMAPQGTWLAQVSYSDGILHLFDPAQPFDGQGGKAGNPRELGRWPKELCRPRVCLAHPDGRHVVMAGYAGYGLTGGGLLVHDLHTGQSDLLTHEQVVPHQSTIAMTALPDGNLVGGTDTAAPGGGHVLAKEATLYVLALRTRQVAYKTVPVPGASLIRTLEVGPDGLVYGLAGGSVFFVFDPATKEIRHRERWAEYGMERDLKLDRQGRLWGLMERAIVRIERGGKAHAKAATPPMDISGGGVILGDRLYFPSRSNLWSCQLP